MPTMASTDIPAFAGKKHIGKQTSTECFAHQET
jgi:hypothetical protein